MVESCDKVHYEWSVVKLDLSALEIEYRKALRFGDYSAAYTICECMLSLIALEMRK